MYFVAKHFLISKRQTVSRTSCIRLLDLQYQYPVPPHCSHLPRAGCGPSSACRTWPCRHASAGPPPSGRTWSGPPPPPSGRKHKTIRTSDSHRRSGPFPSGSKAGTGSNVAHFKIRSLRLLLHLQCCGVGLIFYQLRLRFVVFFALHRLTGKWALLWAHFLYLSSQGMSYSLGKIFSTWTGKEWALLGANVLYLD